MHTVGMLAVFNRKPANWTCGKIKNGPARHNTPSVSRTRFASRKKAMYYETAYTPSAIATEGEAETDPTKYPMEVATLQVNTMVPKIEK